MKYHHREGGGIDLHTVNAVNDEIMTRYLRGSRLDLELKNQEKSKIQIDGDNSRT